jgi:anti-sigma28 factor (negative regulator of flagellin synthesis)
MKFELIAGFQARLSKWSPIEILKLGRAGNSGEGTRCCADELSFIDQENLVQQAHTVFDETPEVRSERVAEIRQQVRTGTYEIPISQLVQTLASIILRRR